MRAGVRLGSTSARSGSGWPPATRPGLIATPVETLRRGRGRPGRAGRLVTERDAVEVVVGCRRRCPGGRDRPPRPPSAYAETAGRPARRSPVRLVDERFSTVGAQRGLQASGVDTRKGRSVIDQAAAVIILQGALDAERASGVAPGRLVEPPHGATGRPPDEAAGAPDDVRGEE